MSYSETSGAPSHDGLAAPLVDTHIHLDTYLEDQQQSILGSLGAEMEAVVSVSMDLHSSRRNLELHRRYPDRVLPAFGFHPEQPLPDEAELTELFAFMEQHLGVMAAVGEVGLPYYSRLEARSTGASWDNRPYEALLERFIQFAKRFNKPVVLHAVYEDADLACDLLEQYGVRDAHFHWFKGSAATVKRMADAGYYISFTPDLLYEPEIRELAQVFPAGQVMTETDGPWPFEGPFEGHTTHPRMTAEVASAWAGLRGISLQQARQILYDNACRFYRINHT